MVTEETSQTIELPEPAFSRDGVTIHLGDCREILPLLPADSVHCCVTSPPYFGLRDYGCDGQIGLEASPLEFVAEMVSVFREVRRVLRPDGICWLNLGDSMAGSWGAQGRPQGDGQMSGRSVASARQIASHPRFEGKTGTRGKEIGLKPKDMMGIPWRVAFALQEDGWYLRQDIIWSKPNPMPESVTDRCTKSHEYIFLLAKSEHYFFDNQAIQEEATNKAPGNTKPTKGGRANVDGEEKHRTAANLHKIVAAETRNKRSVWTVSTKPYGGAHFAVFPPDLIEPCILAGTSEHGCCPACGAPWERLLEKNRVATRPGNNTKIGRASDDPDSPYEKHSGSVVGNRDPQRHCTTAKTVGWEAGCDCGHTETVPCVVLDPFTGSGTTAEVARKNGCQFVGCELNSEYLKLAKKRFKQRPLAMR